jgi:hypothetical protein
MSPPMMKLRNLLIAALVIAACGPKPAPSSQPPAPAPATRVEPAAREAALPLWTAVKRGVLPNGLTYYVLPHGKPEKRAFLWLAVNAGSTQEDDDQRGLAHFVEHMAFNGTRRFPKQDLVNYLEGIGMKFGPDLNAYTSFDETVYQLQVPTDDPALVGKGFDILRDWAADVTFDAVEVDKERGVVLEEWRLGRGAQQRLADKLIQVVFGESRYAQRLPIGLPKILEQAPRDTLVRFYKDWYRPDLMAVIAVGDFADVAAIEKQIVAKFGDLAKPATPRPRPSAGVPAATGTRIASESDRELPISAVGVGNLTEQRRDDLAVGVSVDCVFDGGGERCDLRDEGPQHGDERTNALALGLGLELAGDAGWRTAQPREEFGGAPPAAVRVTRHERGHALLAERARRLWRWVAIEKLQRDRRVDVSEDLRSTGPELLEQATELISRSDTLTDEVVAHSNHTAQCLGLVGQRHECTEAVPVGAQQVGEQVCVAEVGLALGGRVARSRRLDDVGVNRHDAEPALDERVDDESGRPLDGDAQLRRWRQLGQPSDEVRHPNGGMSDAVPSDDRTASIDHAHGVLARGPVQADEIGHGDFLGGTRTTTDARGTCRTLTNWRSAACEPGRDILLPVKVPRSLRGGGSQSGRRAASANGRPRRGAGGSVLHPRRLGSRRQLFSGHDRRVP